MGSPLSYCRVVLRALQWILIDAHFIRDSTWGAVGSVIGFHIIMTYYGFWLPNDPRGSGSWEVWAQHLRPFGPATHVSSEHSVARVPHDREIRRRAKEALKYPAVMLDGERALSVGNGFKSYFIAHQLPCYACAIMPEHVHLVIPQSGKSIEKIMIELKTAAVKQLLADGLHPFQEYAERGEKLPKLWARDGRHRFLFTDADMRGRIGYVEKNPTFGGIHDRNGHLCFRIPERIEPRTK